MNNLRFRKRLRLECASYSDPERVYFATLCARAGNDLFLDPALASMVIEAIRWYRTAKECRVFAYCLMPTHLHIALSPDHCASDVSAFMKDIKSYTTRESWKLGHIGQLWQRSWYDHIARFDEDIKNVCAYILANPLRRGLVREGEEWLGA